MKHLCRIRLLGAGVYTARENGDVLDLRRQRPHVVAARFVDQLGYLLEANLSFATAEIISHARARDCLDRFPLHVLGNAQVIEHLRRKPRSARSNKRQIWH